MNYRITMVALLLACVCGNFAVAEPVAAPDTRPAGAAASAGSEDEQIDQLRKNLTDAFNKRDVDGMLSYLTEDIVVVWQNKEVSYGREGVRDYYKKMMSAENHVVESASFNPTVEKRVKHGDNMAISYGELGDAFHLRDGSEFRLDSRWSATVVRQPDGRWLVASFHASPNAFDNGVLRYATKQAGVKAGIGGLIVGLVAGLVIGLVAGWRRRPAASATTERS